MDMAEKEQPKGTPEELENQLHEQYAINNNSNLTSTLTLICGLLSVIGVYGHVLVNTGLCASEGLGSLITCCGKYTIDALLLTTMASYFIIFVLYYICAYLGTNQRCEQFIIDAIRRKRGMDIGGEDSVFHSKYHPYRKRKCDFIQGLYGEFLHFLRIAAFAITALTAAMVVIYFSKTADACPDAFMIATLIAAVLLFICFHTIINSQYRKYVSVHNRFCEKTVTGGRFGRVQFGRCCDGREEDHQSTLVQKGIQPCCAFKGLGKFLNMNSICNKCNKN